MAFLYDFNIFANTHNKKEDIKMDISKQIFNRVTELLKKRNMTINKFAKKYNLPSTTIYSIGDGKSKSPSIKNILKICNALDISIYDFFNTEEFKSKEYK